MGWGTEFKANVFLSREEVTPENVSDHLAEVENDINSVRTDLIALCSATPKDVTPADEEPLTYVRTTGLDYLDYLEDLIIKRTKIQLYEDSRIQD